MDYLQIKNWNRENQDEDRNVHRNFVTSKCSLISSCSNCLVYVSVRDNQRPPVCNQKELSNN